MTSTDLARPGTLSIRVDCEEFIPAKAFADRARNPSSDFSPAARHALIERWAEHLDTFFDELATVPGRWSVTGPNGDREEFNDLYDLRQIIDRLPFILKSVLSSPHAQILPLGVGGSTFLRFQRLSPDRIYAGIVREGQDVDPNNEVSVQEASDEIYRFLLQVEAISEAKGLRSFEVIRPWFEIALAQVMPKGI